MSQKLALIIGNSAYDDGNLAKLETPDADVNALAEVLRDPAVGGFDQVTALIDQPAAMIRRTVSAFFAGQGRDDLLLLYFSGHGIRDDRGQLFLAAKDTEHNLLRGTAIPAAYITEEMDNSRSRRQVLILDCCHSGAFSHGMKAALGASVGTAAAFEGTGSGRVVLTATDSTQYAWEGDQVIGRAENSVFTHYLIQGLRTGEADTDADGQITLDELYNYIYDEVIHETPKQTPGKWSYGQQGEMVIAKNLRPVVKIAQLPADLQQTVDDPRPWVREGAVRELVRLLHGGQPGLALAAQAALKRLAEDDSRRVAALAAESLVAYDARPSSSDKAGQQPLTVQSEPTEPTSHSNLGTEVKRDPADNVAPELLTHEEAEPEQLSQKKVEPLSGTLKPAATRQVLTGSGIFPIMLGWAVGWGFAWVVSEAFGWSGANVDLVWATVWALVGMISALALRRVEPSINWVYVLAIASGWVLGGTIASNFDQVSGEFVHGAIAGLTISLALQVAKPSTHWSQILIITLCWAMAAFVGNIVGKYLYDNLHEVIGEAIGWYAIPGAITGVITGAIGSITMFWQLSQEHRPASPV